jgi:hypothetical protein
VDDASNTPRLWVENEQSVAVHDEIVHIMNEMVSNEMVEKLRNTVIGKTNVLEIVQKKRSHCW